MNTLPAYERVKGQENPVRKLKDNITKPTHQVSSSAIANYTHLLTSNLTQCFPKAEHLFSFIL